MITYTISGTGTYDENSQIYDISSDNVIGSITNLVPNTEYTLTVSQTLYKDSNPQGIIGNIDTIDIKTKI